MRAKIVMIPFGCGTQDDCYEQKVGPNRDFEPDIPSLPACFSSSVSRQRARLWIISVRHYVVHIGCIQVPPSARAHPTIFQVFLTSTTNLKVKTGSGYRLTENVTIPEQRKLPYDDLLYSTVIDKVSQHENNCESLWKAKQDGSSLHIHVKSGGSSCSHCLLIYACSFSSSSVEPEGCSRLRRHLLVIRKITTTRATGKHLPVMLSRVYCRAQKSLATPSEWSHIQGTDPLLSIRKTGVRTRDTPWLAVIHQFSCSC
jgi:hypothetical protein